MRAEFVSIFFVTILFGTVGPILAEDTEAISVAVENTHSADVATRKSALERLEELGPTAPEHVPIFANCLQDAEADIRQLCARALGKFGLNAELGVLALATAVGDSNRAVSMEAIQSLGRIGPVAEPAVQALGAALERGDKPVKITVLAALQNIGGPQVLTLPQLKAVLHDDDWLVRSFAIDVFAQERSSEAERLLIAALDDPNDQVFLSAEQALRRYTAMQTKLLVGFARFKRRVPFVLITFLTLLLLRRGLLTAFLSDECYTS